MAALWGGLVDFFFWGAAISYRLRLAAQSYGVAGQLLSGSKPSR